MTVLGRIEETDILVHVEDVCVGQAFHIFLKSDELLNVVVSFRRGIEDWVIDDNAMNGVVNVRSQNCFFKFFPVNSSKIELEATKLLVSKVISTNVA